MLHRSTRKKPNTTLLARKASVPHGAPSKCSTSGAMTRSQYAAKRQRLDSSSSAEADAPSTHQGTDTLTQAGIPGIVDAVLRSLPHSSTVMPTNGDANLEQEPPTDDPVDPPLDLNHVSLIQDNLQNIPPAPRTGRTTVLYNKPKGAAIPSIPPNLVEKIESGAFVEMRDMLPTVVV